MATSVTDIGDGAFWQRFWRYRPHFGLRSLLVVTALVSVALAVTVQPILEQRRQEGEIRELQNLGARIDPSATTDRPPAGSNLVSRAFGIGLWRHCQFTVDLTGAEISDDDVRRICTFKRVPIRALSLSNTAVTDKALDYVAQLPDLIVLDLAGTNVTDAGIAKLSHRNQLAKVDVSRTSVSYDALDALERCQSAEVYFSQTKAINDLKQLKVQIVDTPLLFLQEWLITTGEDIAFVFADQVPFTADQFALFSRLKTAEKIHLRDSSIPPGGIEMWKDLTNLQRVELWLCDLKAGQVQELAKLTQLKGIELGYCRIPKDDLDALRRLLPNCKILVDGNLNEVSP